jgi:hypothetical protein
MYVLDYLSDPTCKEKPKDSLTSEHRLLCSGTVYRDVVGDPYKSEGARILLDDPLLLFAVSRPLDEYPLELALEVTVPQVEELEQLKKGYRCPIESPLPTPDHSERQGERASL